VIHKPAILQHCLLNSHWPQIVLLAIILLMPSVIPEVVDNIIEKFSPSTTMEKIGSLFKSESGMETHQVTTRTILWSGSSLLAVFLFLLYVPRSVKESEHTSEDHETQADQVKKSDPVQSLHLYQTAINLTIDPLRESGLQEKISHADNKMESQKVPAQKTAPANSTIVVEPGSDESAEQVIASRYRITELLGRGAMGSVFRAHDAVLDREIALKQLATHLLSEKTFVERFRTEAKALAKLCHANIVQIYDYIEDNGQVWISMELVEGQELEQHITAGKPLCASECLNLGIQMSNAMAYAHDQDVVHRDFKPANVLITTGNNVKVMDFGLARIAQSSTQTQIGTVMGSPPFMSPEQAAGKQAGASSDIYSLGVTLYLMSTGKLPFTGDAQSMLAQHISQKPVPPGKLNEKIPVKLNKLIMSMLEKSTEKRPASMSDIADVLATIKVKH
jgi:tRNA A-37 threonylcarbamoyl transferase component Bud32